MAEEENAAAAEEKPKPKPKAKKSGSGPGLLGLIVVVLNLVASGGGVYLVYMSTLGYVPPQVREAELNKELEEFREQLLTDAVLYTMDMFNTNLDGVPRRLIRLQLALEMLDQEGFEEVIGLGAQARDQIVRVLNKRQFHQINTVQGKLHLKDDIIASLNTVLTNGVVKNVYFTDFLVQ